MDSKQDQTYLKVLTLTFISVTMTIAFVIYLVNPYLLYNHSGVFSNTPYPERVLLNRFNTTFLMNRLNKRATIAETSHFVIGSSRALKGFNNCQNNTFTLLSKSSLSPSEANHIVSRVAQHHSNANLFIELGASPLSVLPETSISTGMLNHFINSSALSASLRVIKEALVNPEYKHSCAYTYELKRTSPSHATSTQVERLGYQVLNNDNTMWQVTNFINAMATHCSIHNSLSLTFFQAPIHPLILEKLTLFEENLISLQATVDAMAHQCESIRVVSYTEILDRERIESLKEDQYWFDINHFTPEIGNRFLDRLFLQ